MSFWRKLQIEFSSRARIQTTYHHLWIPYQVQNDNNVVFLFSDSFSLTDIPIELPLTNIRFPLKVGINELT